MKSIFSFVLLFSTSAMADLQLGIFTGVDKSGQACIVNVESMWFVDGKKHPLNERVTVHFEDSKWDLAHPVIINEEAGTVTFDHNFFQQTAATPVGANSFILKIDHDAQPHAPKEAVLIVHHYKDIAQSRKVVCSGLKLE